MTEEADVVIVGSGISGAMCAWRLARAGRRVLVLEAGPRIKREDIVRKFSTAHRHDFSWGYPNSPSAPRPDWSSTKPDRYIAQDGPIAIPFEYLRVVGGTTWHWAASCDRFLPSDFRLKSEYGVGVDWPFGYQDLEPYYAEIERELGVSGGPHAQFGSPRSSPLPMSEMPAVYGETLVMDKLAGLGVQFVSQAAARNSEPYDGRPRCDGHGTCMPICPIGAQYAAIVHVEKAERLGARVLDNCRVDRFETDDAGRITAVQFGRSDGSTDRAVGKVFVLAANAVESPRLLLASASEKRPQGVANTSGQVGRNFMAHYAFITRMGIAEPVHFGRGPVRTRYITSYRDLPSRKTQSAAFVMAENVLDLFSTTIELLEQNLLPPELDAAIKYRAAHEATFFCFIEHLPQAENRITIDWTDRDSAGQPRIHVRYGLTDYERNCLTAMRSNVASFAKTLSADWTKEWDNMATNHLAGTLRMGTDPRASVVDPEGRAHDHPNLFVVGGSVFPTNPACGPTLTIAALALRTADVIGREPH